MISSILGKSVLAAVASGMLAASAAAQPALLKPSAPQTAIPVFGMHRSEALACDNQGILNRIVSKFRHQVKHVPNLPDVDIVEFRRVHEHRNYVATEEWPIPRRYCGATAQLSDGRAREVWYLIEGGMGFATLHGDNVEFCVSGFDRWHVYNGRCRVLR
jgi:capsid protein